VNVLTIISFPHVTTGYAPFSPAPLSSSVGGQLECVLIVIGSPAVVLATPRKHRRDLVLVESLEALHRLVKTMDARDRKTPQVCLQRLLSCDTSVTTWI
jgi:hypothetical protein